MEKDVVGVWRLQGQIMGIDAFFVKTFLMDCMKFLFCRELIGQDWLISCGNYKSFYETHEQL